MTTLLDLFYVALFAVAFPLWDYFVFWPAFRRKSQADPTRARMRVWRWAFGSAWALVAVGAGLWVWNDRSWASLGLAVPDGWRLWASLAVIVLLALYFVYAATAVARSSDTRASLRRQFGKLASLLPHTRTEMHWFGGVSLTAGFCEEFLYRGYFIWVFAPWLGWWGAAALSLPFFALGHVGVYQEWSGAVRTGIVGAVFTLAVAVFDSLWPALALHALLDLGQGMIAWLALREGQSTEGEVVPA
jgi:membrane protease YdiL (CAAX protease family)